MVWILLFGEVSIAYYQGLSIEALWISHLQIKILHKLKKNQNSTFLAKFYTFSWFSDTHKKISCSSNFMFWTASDSNVNIYLREYLSRLCKFENFWKLLPQIDNIFITGKIKHTLKYSKGHKIWAKRGIELQFSGFAPLSDTKRI